MAERGISNSRRAGSAGPRARNASRNASRSTTAASSARSSGVFDRDATPHAIDHSSTSSSYFYPNRYNPSLHTVGSRTSLAEQFATTRKEYEFGFDDAVSFVAQSDYDGEKDVDVEDEDDEDDTLTGAGSFDGLVVVPPFPDGGEDGDGDGDGDAGDMHGGGGRAARVHRSHYEVLCLPEESALAEGDIRRAYFRLYDILRSQKMPTEYRNVAETYFSDVQAAFETLMGKRSKEEYDSAVLDEDDDTSSEGDHDQDGEHAKGASVRRTNPRFVRRLRRQQEQDCTEVGVQVDAKPLFSQSKSSVQHRKGLPTALSLTHTTSTSFPPVSRFLQPRIREMRNALKGPAVSGTENEDEDLEIYCTPPTVAISTSVFATNVRSAYLPPAGVLSQYQTIMPDALPKDRPLEWYSTSLAPLVSLKLRQEVFFRQPGLSETALRRTLPDAVLELETDTLNVASVTARASHALRLDGTDNDDVVDEPVHVEASVSVNRSWLSRSFASRLGLAAHKRLSSSGGTVFACTDSGTSSLWDSLSPASFWDGRGAERDGTGSSWRSYMDQLSRSLERGLMPYYYSPPTAEVGYKFSSCSDEAMGMPFGRPFTKQSRSGLKQLHDDVDLVDAGKGGSWTVSGAITAGGVAGYLRYGKDLFSSRSPSLPLEEAPQLPSRWKDHLGFRMEAEITTQKMKNDAVLGRLSSWGNSEISHLAIRGLKRIGKSSKVGLELGVNSASNSVVLSVYFSQQHNKRVVIPVMLFRDHPLTNQHQPTYYTKILFWSAFLPALGLAAVDHVLASRARARAQTYPSTKKGAKRAEKVKQERVQRTITHRRAEADALVTLLAEPVLQRQRLQRERGGLVVLSAKYGVLLDPASASSPDPKWTAPEEVADVTVAAAALVDDEGTLQIPEGLRKSKLLGFWDPKPGRTKWLVVRYGYGGKEGTRAVSARQELKLP